MYHHRGDIGLDRSKERVKVDLLVEHVSECAASEDQSSADLMQCAVVDVAGRVSPVVLLLVADKVLCVCLDAGRLDAFDRLVRALADEIGVCRG